MDEEDAMEGEVEDVSTRGSCPEEDGSEEDEEEELKGDEKVEEEEEEIKMDE